MAGLAGQTGQEPEVPGQKGQEPSGLAGTGEGIGSSSGSQDPSVPEAEVRTFLPPPSRETVALQHELPPKEVPDMGALYGIYVHGKGWSDFFADNAYGMAPTDSYITGIRVTLHNQSEEMSGTIRYRVNLSGMGWLDWVSNAQEAGNITGDMHLEAVAMELTGELAQHYDVLYSVLQNNQWTDWVKNGEEAGQSGVGLRID